MIIVSRCKDRSGIKIENVFGSSEKGSKYHDQYQAAKPLNSPMPSQQRMYQYNGKSGVAQ